MPKKPGGTQTYLLQGIPPDLWDAVKVKARSQDPAPFTLRWAILTALQEWVAAGTKGKSPRDTERPQMF